MTDDTVISLPEPHEAQRQVLAGAKRFNVVCCGRRWGKTRLGIDRIVAAVLDGHPTGWFAPSYKLQLEAWREIQAALGPVITARHNAEYRLEVRGGGSVTMFSLDSGDAAESTRGRAFKTVIIDEAALVRELRRTWETAIRPTLADYRGDAWMLSTPRGRNDFAVFFDRGQDVECPDWVSWQMQTSSNPFIAAEEIEAARQDLTERAFAQEFLACFMEWEGSIFRNVQACATAERQDGPEDGHRYIIGCDWGRSNDYTVFTVLDATSRAMVDMDRSNRVDYVVQRGRLQALWERWGQPKIIAEANSIGQPIIEQLQRDGLRVTPFNTTSASKAEIIEGLALLFEQQSIAILPDPVLLGELQAYQAEQLPGGSLRYSAPSGQHDDTVMSLALAASVLRDKGGVLGWNEFLLRLRDGAAAVGQSVEQYFDQRRKTWETARAKKRQEAERAAAAARVKAAVPLKPVPSPALPKPIRHCPKCNGTMILDGAWSEKKCATCLYQWDRNHELMYAKLPNRRGSL